MTSRPASTDEVVLVASASEKEAPETFDTHWAQASPGRVVLPFLYRSGENTRSSPTVLHASNSAVFFHILPRFSKLNRPDFLGIIGIETRRKLPESSSFGSRIVLVVDDEPTITDTIVLVLNHSNQNIFALGSTDLAQALSIVHGIRPDLVLLDVKMPGAVRLEHAVEMRDKCGCRVLLMSGETTTSEDIDGYLESGGQPFEILAKPIHPTDLIKQIQQMLNEPPTASQWKNPLSFHLQ